MFTLLISYGSIIRKQGVFQYIFYADVLYVCSVLCEDEKQAVAVKSQLQMLARPMYSNPPVHGALVVSTILGDQELKTLWLKEVKVSNCSYASKLSLEFLIKSHFRVG